MQNAAEEMNIDLMERRFTLRGMLDPLNALENKANLARSLSSEASRWPPGTVGCAA